MELRNPKSPRLLRTNRSHLDAMRFYLAFLGSGNRLHEEQPFPQHSMEFPEHLQASSQSPPYRPCNIGS